MPNFARPGVYVTEQLNTGAPTPSSTSPSVAGFIGEHWRGPSYAVQCNSWADFVQAFGGFNSNATPVLANGFLPFAVYEFFVNGGQTCQVARVLATATPGMTASKVFVDQAATPQNTLQLIAGRLGVAGNVGTWGNSLFVDVVARGGASSGRFDLNIYYGGSSAAFRVEQWIDLSMNQSDARYVVSVLNSPTSGSLWVVANDGTFVASTTGGSIPALTPSTRDTSAPPNNTPAPVTGAQFTGGVDTVDPSVSDRTTAVTFGSSPFDQVPGILNMNLPGESTSGVVEAAITYAQTRPYTFLVIDTASGLTPAGAVSYLQGLAPVSSYAAVYYPWVLAQDPSSSSLSATKLLPPGGFVLGQINATDNSRGVWKAPAGLAARLGVVSAERRFTPTDLDTLNTNNVNAIKTRADGSVVIFGARTMQTGYASLYVPIRRTLNYIEFSLSESLQFAVFEPNAAPLWGLIMSVCNQFLGGLFSKGAFPGPTPASSFYVVCDSSNNTAQTISQGVVNVTVGVALLYPAEFISILLTQFQSTGTTTTTTSL